MRYGESMTREGIPDEVLLQIMRRADAEQNRYVNLARIAEALGGPGNNTSHSLARQAVDALNRIADALDRAFPFPELTEGAPEDGQEAADDAAA